MKRESFTTNRNKNSICINEDICMYRLQGLNVSWTSMVVLLMEYGLNYNLASLFKLTT